MVGIRFSEWRATLFRAALREFAGPRVAAFQRAALIVSTFSVCVRVLVVTKGEFDFVVRLSQNMEKERERERESCLPAENRRMFAFFRAQVPLPGRHRNKVHRNSINASR